MQKCTNRFLIILVCEMKRIIACFLSLLFIFNLASCGEINDNAKKENIVAVKYPSANEKAFESYASQDFIKVTYNTSSDVVLAVENGKADFGILDAFEFNSFITAQRKIKKKELCKYSIDYCAYFSSGNEELQKEFNNAINTLKTDGTLEKIKDAHLNGESFVDSERRNVNGTLTMLCDPSFDNRVYTDSNGHIVGLDVDIAREICNSLGYNLEIESADFDELFIKLEKGKGDFIISACEVSEERAEYYLLSDTYFTLDFYLIEKE